MSPATAPAPGNAPADPVAQTMAAVGRGARAAAAGLAEASTEAKNAALAAMAGHVRTETATILAANGADCARAEARGISGAFLDRLRLDAPRIEAMAGDLEAIAGLPDPVWSAIGAWKRP